MRQFKNGSRMKSDVVDCVLIAETLFCGDFGSSGLDGRG